MRVAINGFGRIGRALTRLLVKDPSIELVAINDLMDIDTAAHLLRFDSIHREYDLPVESQGNQLVIGNSEVRFYQEPLPNRLSWNSLDVDVVVECTGKFKEREEIEKHLSAGAQRVLLSAPPQDDSIQTICLGANDDQIDWSQAILSNASCTTNSAAPLVKVMQSLGEIQTGYITTVHSYTTDQQLHDTPHKDLRRARAGALSIVPTTTGAAKAITKVFPDLEGKIGGCGIRVPVPDGSLTDMTFILDRTPSEQEVNEAFRRVSEQEMKGIISYIDLPLVSSDIIGNSHSCVFDSLLTSVIGDMVKVVGWYDNEIGYSNRLKDVLNRMKKKS